MIQKVFISIKVSIKLKKITNINILSICFIEFREISNITRKSDSVEGANKYHAKAYIGMIFNWNLKQNSYLETASLFISSSHRQFLKQKFELSKNKHYHHMKTNITIKLISHRSLGLRMMKKTMQYKSYKQY